MDSNEIKAPQHPSWDANITSDTASQYEAETPSLPPSRKMSLLQKMIRKSSSFGKSSEKVDFEPTLEMLMDVDRQAHELDSKALRKRSSFGRLVFFETLHH